MSSINTAIEWTDKTWNPTTGCTKVSPGCKYCYAEAITERFPQSFPKGFELTLHPKRLEDPKKWRTPSRIFVNSMSDLFHEEIPFEFLKKVFDTIEQTPWHIYQILTKRPERVAQLADGLNWSENIWMGVSIESQKYINRIDYLRCVPARIRFLSCEPLLSPLSLQLEDIHWVIVGGESGLKHRTMKPEWVEGILLQCHQANVPFFFKQWGGRHSKAGGRIFQERTWDEMPPIWEQHLEKWSTNSTNPQLSLI